MQPQHMTDPVSEKEIFWCCNMYQDYVRKLKSTIYANYRLMDNCRVGMCCLHLPWKHMAAVHTEMETVWLAGHWNGLFFILFILRGMPKQFGAVPGGRATYTQFCCWGISEIYNQVFCGDLCWGTERQTIFSILAKKREMLSSETIN